MNPIIAICAAGAVLTGIGAYFANSEANRQQWLKAHAAFWIVGTAAKVLVETRLA